MSVSRLTALLAFVLPNFGPLCEPLHVFEEETYRDGRLVLVEKHTHPEPMVVIESGISSHPRGSEALTGQISGYKYCLSDSGRLYFVEVGGSWERDGNGAERIVYTLTFHEDDTCGDQLDMVDVAQVLDSTMRQKGFSEQERRQVHGLMEL